METVTEGWIPQDWQVIASFVFMFVIIVGAVLKYFRDRDQADDAPQPSVDIRLLGAAFGERQALEAIAEAAVEIAQTCKELRAIRDREAERDLNRFPELVEVLARIAVALEIWTGVPSPRRRRPRLPPVTRGPPGA